MTVNANVTGSIYVGDRIQLTNNSLTQYFIVTAISYSSPNTTITLFGGTISPIVLSAAHTHAGGAITSFAVKALPYPVASGAIVTMPNGDQVTTSAAATAGATTIDIDSFTPSATLGWAANDVCYANNYILANSAITSPAFSHVYNPAGMNMAKQLWTLRVGSASYVDKANPTNGTWYASGISLAVPIGVWVEIFNGTMYQAGTNTGGLAEMLATLAASSAAQDDLEMTVVQGAGGVSGFIGSEDLSSFRAERDVTVGAAATHYINYQTDVSGTSATIGLDGGYQPTTIQLRCAFV